MRNVEATARSMPFTRSPVARSWAALPLLGALLAISVGVAWADTSKRITVSQRGRTFAPGSMAIQENDTLVIVNDDGNVVHHAYVDDPEFSFDSNDQEPGVKTDITFTKPGTFNVLCGIHPKMKLVVTVKEWPT